MNIITTLIEVLIVATGTVFIVWGLLVAFYYAAGKIIKLLGYWPLFYRGLMYIGKERNEKSSTNKNK